MGGLRPRLARQQSRRRFRTRGIGDDEQVRARRRTRRGGRRQQSRGSARSQVPRNRERPRRADFRGVDVHAALARRQLTRRHAGAAGPQSAALQHDLRDHCRSHGRPETRGRGVVGQSARRWRHAELRRTTLRGGRAARHAHRTEQGRCRGDRARRPQCLGAGRHRDRVACTVTRAAPTRAVPADFIPIFARAVVDAGADVFVGHGPHVLRGVEVYKGKPILYSLSNFIFQNETLLRMPADSYEQYSLDDDVAQPSDYLDARYDKDRRSFPGGCGVLGFGGGGDEVGRQHVRRAAAAPDHARLQDLARRARPPEAGLRRRRAADSGDDDGALETLRRRP